jgi:hypothetical protein
VEAHCRLRQNREALAVCLEGRELYPNDPELHLAEGLVRRDLGDMGGAETCLLRLIDRNPADSVAHFHLNLLRSQFRR